MPYLGVAPNPRENREVDDISSGFNGGTTQFTLQSGGSNVSPGKDTAIIVSLGGVVQNPGTDYTIAASTITFTTAPASGLSFFGVVLAQSIDIETVADNTVTTAKIVNDAVTADKLAHTSVTAGSYTTADITVDAQGRITAAASGTIANAEIADGAITNAKVNASAAIARTKLANVDVVDDTTPQLGGNLDTNSFEINFDDNHAAIFGDSSDLKVLHTGTVSRIDFSATSHSLEIMGSGGSNFIDLQPRNGHSSVKAIANGAAELYHDNSLRLATDANGIAVTTNVTFPDNGVAVFGAGSDLQISHSGSQSLITHGGTGQLIIRGNDNDQVKIMKGSSEEGIILNNNGDVELYHNNILRFETFTEGAHVHVSGNSGLRIIGTNANVDPRLVFRRKNNDGNNSEPAAIRMTYVAGTTHESGHLDFLTNGSSGSAALSVKVRFQNDGVKYFDSTFDSTANNARKSYFTGTGQLVMGRNAHESYIVFQDVSNNVIGNIVRGAGSSVAYNTTSDYRLKENVVDISDAITRLKTLKPKRFNFISDPSITLDGFIAHEVTAVPEAVEGEKDAVVTQAMIDSQEVEQKSVGDPIYQGIDQSKLVPLLTAALQEAIAKIETLETKVAALESA